MKIKILACCIFSLVGLSGCALLYRDEIPRDEVEYSVWNAVSAPSVAKSWHPSAWFTDGAGLFRVYGRREFVSVGYPAGIKSAVWLCVPNNAANGVAVNGVLYVWGYKNEHRIGVDEIVLLSVRDVSVIRDVASETNGKSRVRLTGSPDVDAVYGGIREYVVLPAVTK